MYGKGLHAALFTFQTYYYVTTYLCLGKQVSWPSATSWSNGVGSPPFGDVIPDICYMMSRVALSLEGWIRTLPSRSGLLEDILYGNIQGVSIYHAMVVMVAQPGCVYRACPVKRRYGKWIRASHICSVVHAALIAWVWLIYQVMMYVGVGYDAMIFYRYTNLWVRECWVTL